MMEATDSRQSNDSGLRRWSMLGGSRSDIGAYGGVPAVPTLPFVGSAILAVALIHSARSRPRDRATARSFVGAIAQNLRHLQSGKVTSLQEQGRFSWLIQVPAKLISRGPSS